MKKLLTLSLLLAWGGHSMAQSVYTLDSCRSMAIHNNKELRIADERIKAAGYSKKSAFGNYLPGIDFAGGYMYNSKNISLLSEDKFLPIGSMMPDGTFGARQDQTNNRWVNVNGQWVPLDANGQPFNPKTDPGKILWKDYTTIPKDQFEFDTKNVFVGAITITQPIYMGGKIRAYNQITKYAEELAQSQKSTAVKDVIFRTDETYWQVVSLVHKKKLADSYVNLLDTLSSNVQAMIQEGVATQSDGLTVAVKLNEAQITQTKVEDGLSLSKMLLAQICGLPIDTDFSLFDETVPPSEVMPSTLSYNMEEVYKHRGEIQSLNLATKIYEKKQRLALSEMLPNLAVTGSYMFSNPNVFNGFETKFNGMFNVGVMLKVPIFHWGKDFYKVKAAKAETHIAKLELEGAKEKIELQVNQASFKMNEAIRKMGMTRKNMEKAEENLRNARLGFEEGVLTTNNVLEAQTAWLQAQSEKIDAEIDVRLCEVYLSKAIGTMDDTSK